MRLIFATAVFLFTAACADDLQVSSKEAGVTPVCRCDDLEACSDDCVVACYCAANPEDPSCGDPN